MSGVEPQFAAAAAAPVFAALGNPTRLSLVTRLLDGEPHSIVQLSDGLDLTRQGVTKHLHVLEQAGIVHSERVGRESRYHLRPAAIETARTWLERASQQWDEALSRLRNLVEDDGQA